MAPGPALAQDEPATTTATELPSIEVGFGDYQLVPLLGDETPYAGPATPTSLDGVAMTDLVDGLLTPEARTQARRAGLRGRAGGVPPLPPGL